MREAALYEYLSYGVFFCVNLISARDRPGHWDSDHPPPPPDLVPTSILYLPGSCYNNWLHCHSLSS